MASELRASAARSLSEKSRESGRASDRRRKKEAKEGGCAGCVAGLSRASQPQNRALPSAPPASIVPMTLILSAHTTSSYCTEVCICCTLLVLYVQSMYVERAVCIRVRHPSWPYLTRSAPRSTQETDPSGRTGVVICQNVPRSEQANGILGGGIGKAKRSRGGEQTTGSVNGDRREMPRPEVPWQTTYYLRIQVH